MMVGAEPRRMAASDSLLASLFAKSAFLFASSSRFCSWAASCWTSAALFCASASNFFDGVSSFLSGAEGRVASGTPLIDCMQDPTEDSSSILRVT